MHVIQSHLITTPTSRWAWLAVMTLLVLAAPAWALTAAGDNEQTWIILPREDSVVVWHRQVGRPPYQVQTAAQLSGQVVAGAAAADRLWVVYDDQTVQLLRTTPDRHRSNVTLTVPHLRASLPPVAALHSLTASHRGPWALVQVQEPASDDSDDAAAEPGDQLLHLAHQQWEAVDLPGDWPHMQPGWALMLREDDAYPTLVSISRHGGQTTVTLFSRDSEDSGWRSRQHSLGAVGAGDIVLPVAVGGQVVVGQADPSAQGDLAVSVSLLRREGLVNLGTLELVGLAQQPWTLTRLGSDVVLAGLDEAGQVHWTSLNLRGQVSDPPGVLAVRPISPLAMDPGRVVVVAVLVSSMLIMFLHWRHDPRVGSTDQREQAARQRSPDLPANLLLADHFRRLLAFLIDLAPCLLAASLVTGLPLDRLADFWPGLAMTWKDMLPGGIVIGTLVGHCTLLELLTGRSAGKLLTGLHVVTLHGDKPRAWQVLVRNLLKAFDLIVFYILPILALVGPARQRLGDMVARTLVVVPASSDESRQINEP